MAVPGVSACLCLCGIYCRAFSRLPFQFPEKTAQWTDFFAAYRGGVLNFLILLEPLGPPLSFYAGIDGLSVLIGDYPLRTFERKILSFRA